MFKALINRFKKSSKSLLSSAVELGWKEYAKNRLFDDPSEMLEAKRAFEAGFSAAEILYKKETL